MLLSREAMHSVVSFKPLGIESWSRIAGACSWSQEETRRKIAAYETIFKLNGDESNAKKWEATKNLSNRLAEGR